MMVTANEQLEADVVEMEKQLAGIAMRIQELVDEMKEYASQYQSYRMCQAEINGLKEVKSCVQSQLRSARHALGG